MVYKDEEHWDWKTIFWQHSWSKSPNSYLPGWPIQSFIGLVYPFPPPKKKSWPVWHSNFSRKQISSQQQYISSHTIEIEIGSSSLMSRSWNLVVWTQEKTFFSLNLDTTKVICLWQKHIITKELLHNFLRFNLLCVSHLIMGLNLQNKKQDGHKSSKIWSSSSIKNKGQKSMLTRPGIKNIGPP